MNIPSVQELSLAGFCLIFTCYNNYNSYCIGVHNPCVHLWMVYPATFQAKIIFKTSSGTAGLGSCALKVLLIFTSKTR